jgi:hypothetical protein
MVNGLHNISNWNVVCLAVDSVVMLFVSSFFWAAVWLKCGFSGNSGPLKQEVIGLKKYGYKNKVLTEIDLLCSQIFCPNIWVQYFCAAVSKYVVKYT